MNVTIKEPSSEEVREISLALVSATLIERSHCFVAVTVTLWLDDAAEILASSGTDSKVKV